MADNTTSNGPMAGGGGLALRQSNISFGTLMASLGAGAAAFAVQFLLFNVLRFRLKRIYSPKTYLVPEKERVPDPPPGIFGWAIALFKTSNMDFIEKCGLDAYFFLRYLRMLLKIFLPLAIILIPILLPTNSVNLSSNDSTGVNRFSWTNIPQGDQQRFWVHLVAAVCMDAYICYVMFGELRGYIRIRQAYLTSPQHRLRASATTVLVTNISRKWLTREALDGLYDVFPGGVRNIWINRNFDELDSLVQTRDSMANSLEDLYANLIKKAQKQFYQHQKKSRSDTTAPEVPDRPGLSTGNPHQIAQTLDEALGREMSGSSDSLPRDHEDKKHIPIFSDVAQGFEAVGQGLGQGFDAVGQGVGKLGHFVRGGMTDTFGRGKRAETKEQSAIPSQNDGSEDPFANNAAQLGASDPNPPTRFSGASDDFVAAPAAQEPEGSNGSQIPKRGLSFRFKGTQQKSHYPSPQPKAKHGDEYPLTEFKTRASGDSTIDIKPSNPNVEQKKSFWAPVVGLFVNSLENELPSKRQLLRLTQAETERRQRLVEQTNPTWTTFLKESDRDTTHQHPSPLLNWIPYVGTKVDAIDYRTVTLAAYNKKIEQLQKDPERFQLMNSAFIQFNHQIAAHMACQSLNHHVPLQMAPRTVEISPDDVQWGNLSIPWWMRYLRTIAVIAAVVGLIIVWAFPVAFTGSLSQLDQVAKTYHWLGFVSKWPTSVRSIIQGVLPPALIGLLLVLLPLTLRFLTSVQGISTSTQLELSVQMYYFVFLFIQVFLVVTLSSGISTILDIISGTTNVTNVPNILASSLPTASNYFFSFIILQALSVSAGAILQLVNIFLLYLWSTMVDSSPRSLFKRSTTLPTINWGTFFPVYTNFAVIGIVYAIIAPLIMVFVIVTFALFWVVHRYNALYVNRYTNDTGGLLFPRAVTQLFTGLYTMHICLFGLFLLETKPGGALACLPQAIIIVVCFLFLILYQIILNRHFSPLYRYIPISMEDDAVERDEEFAALQDRKHEEGRLADEDQLRKEQENLQDVLRNREREEEEESQALEESDRKRIEDRRKGRDSSPLPSQHLSPGGTARKSSRASRSSKVPDKSWADPANNVPVADTDGAAASKARKKPRPHHRHRHTPTSTPHISSDLEAQKPIEERFYSGINDELEDLTKDERDILVNKAFQHRALRATRPAVWIPKDRAGVSEFEIMVIDSSEELRQYIWISDEGASLTKQGGIDEKMMRRPPDFNEEKLIKL